jgi:TRAP-type C4-dicarboxylate transport system permease large subunit
MTGRNILKITKAAMPFFFLMLLGIIILVIFPQIVTAPVQYMIQ